MAPPDDGQPMVRTVLHGGCVLTVRPGTSITEEPQVVEYSWLLLCGARVLRLGIDSPPADAFEGAIAIDLKGALVLPGLFDSHCHVFETGKLQDSLILEGTSSIQDLQEKLKSYHAKNSDMKVIIGNGWDQELLGRFPTKADLDVVDVPVVVYRRCWHVCCANSAALLKCGVRGGEEVEGGSIDFEQGILREGAMDHFLGPLKTAGSAEGHRQILRRGLGEFLRFGCTSVLTNDGELIGGIKEPWKRYSELAEANELPIRVFLTVDWKELNKPSGQEVGDHQDPPLISDSHLKVFRIKLWTDGGLGASTAALEEPYSDDPEGKNRGILQIEPAEIRRAIGLARAAGFGVEAHTIGDRSARELLDAFAECGISGKDRYTMTHCQILSPELIKRMGEVGVVASIQPQFTTSDAAVAPERLGRGSQRLRSSYAWNSLLQSGVRLAGGSDAPVETPDPLMGMYRAMVNDIHASESVSFARALQMYTTGGAFTAGREGELGALLPGFNADFVITSLVGGRAAAEDPTRFKNAQVKEVWVGGVRKYAAEGSAPPVPSVIAPEGPGKRGINFFLRGPCPCCGPRTVPPSKRRRVRA